MQVNVLIVALVAGICSCQQKCSLSSNDDLEQVITDIIQFGDSASLPTVTVARFHPVCLAFGQQQDRYRLVSVVVEYTCSGNINCPSDTAVEEIESECISGVWSNIVLGSTVNTRSVTTDASFNTTTREDCSFCLSPELADSMGATTDNVTHCVACDSSCDEGLMRCFEVGPNDCCNFYNNSMCMDECPSPFIPNTVNECVCPVGTTGHDCEDDIDCGALDNPVNGEVSVSSTIFNSTATYSCNAGYNMTGNYVRTCLESGLWSGSEPICTEIDCGVLINPANGEVVAFVTTFNSTATYSCNTGYTLTGDDMRTCLETGLWSGSEPMCTEIDCGALDGPVNGDVSVSSTTYNSTATYSCNTGYTLTGDDMRTCMESGLWSGSEPICVVIDCGPLDNPANGEVSVPSTAFSFNATYSCNTGYTLTGDDMRMCMESGLWSGSEPICVVVDCGALDNPANGEVFLTNTTFNSVATYSCNTGYNLTGDNMRTCLETGFWSGSDPTCSIIDCGPLDHPANGEVSVPSTAFSFNATYSCNTGYTLTGDDMRMCMESGLWSGSEPICVVVDCGALDNPANGEVFLMNTIFNSTATYSCNTGFTLIGDNMRTCLETGFWSSSEPMCTDVDCGTLGNPANGEVSASNTNYNSTAMYSCNTGYTLTGHIIRTCLESGLWSGSEPTCVVIDCGPLGDPPNGEVSVSSKTVNSTATYSCNTGYTLTGNDMRTCLETGLWSGSEPMCTDINCGALGDPANGEVSLSSTIFNSTATYSCNTGYTLTGDGTRTCLETGLWSGSEPMCTEIDCGALDGPVNGDVSVSSTTYNSTATYSCNTGYTLTGDDMRTCMESGLWSGSEPICVVIDCGPLDNPANGEVSVPSTAFSFNATYSCNTGYTLTGDDMRMCMESGLWSGSEPICVVVDCGALDNPANGEVFLTNTTFNSVATYSCNTGYNLTGDNMRTCLETGFWSGSDPTCSIIDCGPLDHPANGEVSVSSTTFSFNATYSCNTGYTLTGDDMRMCMESGLWSGSEPICVVVDCGALDNPVNGEVFLMNTIFNSTATYSCNTGYTLTGHGIRTCLETGFWSGSEPTCSVIDCGALGDPANGEVSVSGTIFTSVATYSCNTGYNLTGHGIRTCLHTGFWSGSEPTCADVDCGTLGNPANGEVSASNTNYNSTAMYSCNTGFTLTGHIMRTCLESGLWSGSEPTCTVIDCGVLGDPTNGEVLLSSTTFNSAATYSCNTGYTLTGDDMRTCLQTGLWSGSEPMCTDIDECSSSPMLCVNGDCMNTIGGYTCDCFDGYDGPHCEVDINECLEADCANGATCIDRVAGYSCECRDGSSGDNCEECDISDCQTCQFATDPIQCAQCSDGYFLNDDGFCECGITNCVECEGLPPKCRLCKDEYMLSATGERCDTQCQVENCLKCTEDRDSVCDVCQSDYVLNNGLCDGKDEREDDGTKRNGLNDTIISAIIAAVIIFLILLVVAFTCIIVCLLNTYGGEERQKDKKRQYRHRHRVVQRVKTNPACLLGEQVTEGQLEAQITLEAEYEAVEMIDKSGDEGEWEGGESDGEGEEEDGEFGDGETGPLSNETA